MSKTSLLSNTAIKNRRLGRSPIGAPHGAPMRGLNPESSFASPAHVEDDKLPEEQSPPRELELHCFNCNRKESFFFAYRGRWFYSYLIGFTFGLAYIVGPYKCRCCGHNRLSCSDSLHPRRWFGG